jgi:hypothetical protein
VVSIVRTLKEMRKDANFLLNSGFWILDSGCASTIVERTQLPPSIKHPLATTPGKDYPISFSSGLWID